MITEGLKGRDFITLHDFTKAENWLHAQKGVTAHIIP